MSIRSILHESSIDSADRHRIIEILDSLVVDPSLRSSSPSSGSKSSKRRLSLKSLGLANKEGTSLTRSVSSPKSLHRKLFAENDRPEISNLFEHFLIVGASNVVANELTTKLVLKDASNQSSFMKRIAKSLFIGKSGNLDSVKGKDDDITSEPSSAAAETNLSIGSSEKINTTPPRRSSLSLFAESMMKRIQTVGTKEKYDKGEVSDTMVADEGVEKLNESTSQEMSAESHNIILFPENQDDSAIVNPSLLYRFPLNVDPPPQEVVDFCNPAGSVLKNLTTSRESTSRCEEILYSQGSMNSSSKCYVFILEDKTVDDKIYTYGDEERGNSNKLYGICVLQPRLLKGTHTTTKQSYQQMVAESNDAYNTNFNGSSERVEETAYNEEVEYEYETSVAMCFITRFPLFNFFFDVIFDMINGERIGRLMDLASIQEPINDYHELSRNIYQYIPSGFLTSVLSRLTCVKPPLYGEDISFQAHPSLMFNLKPRHFPPTDCPEYLSSAAQWALPVLFSWMPVETIIWCLSMLICEVKIICVGSDPGKVSCAVFGLLALLSPLNWVAPLIPILPLKNLDFVESPVPILAGVIIDSNITPSFILKKCDSENAISAVLDVNERELYVPKVYQSQLKTLLIPAADTTINCIKDTRAHCLQMISDNLIGVNLSQQAISITQAQRIEAKSIQDVIVAKIRALIAIGEAKISEKQIVEVNNSLSENEVDDIDLSIPIINILANDDDIKLEYTEDDEKLSSGTRQSIFKSFNRLNFKRLEDLSLYGYGSQDEFITAVSKDPLDSDIEGFMNRFINTQMFAEYIDAKNDACGIISDNLSSKSLSSIKEDEIKLVSEGLELSFKGIN